MRGVTVADEASLSSDGRERRGEWMGTLLRATLRRGCEAVRHVRCVSSAAPRLKATISDLLPSLERLQLAENRFALPASTPISAAARHLESERLTFALVTDDVRAPAGQRHHADVVGQDVVGVLTERSILEYATHAGALAFFSGREHGEPAASRWMTPRSKMLSVRLDDTLEQALSTIHTGNWRHLPVLDYYNKLHSILDLRDVLDGSLNDQQRDAVWKGCSALSILGAKRKSKILGDVGGGKSWHDALSAYLLEHARRHTISSRATVEAAAKQMRREHLTFLVVRETQAGGADERVVGLVNERSFLAFASKSDPDGAAEAVASIMTPIGNTVHVNATDPASHVIDVFFSHNLRHLPVIDRRSHLVGIISVRDLMRPIINPDPGM